MFRVQCGSRRMAKFTYFDGAGRALPCRLALFNAFGKDGWTDDRLSFADFGPKKVWRGGRQDRTHPEHF